MGFFDELTRRQFMKNTVLGSTYFLLNLHTLIAETSQEKDVNLSKKTVLVIGAGVSGLAAAQKLRQYGARVIVIEAKNTIGGRLQTDHSFGVPFELGAGWIHSPVGNPISQLAKLVNAQTYMTDNDNLLVYNREGKIISDDDLEKLDKNFVELMQGIESYMDERKDITLEEAIRKLNPEVFENELMMWALTAFTEFDQGGPIEKLSAKYFTSDETFEGNDVILTNGYDSILKPLAEGLTIKLNHTVEEIEYEDDGVIVTTNKKRFEGDYAVVTLPLGVLKKNAVTFTPPLPSSHQKRIDKLTFGNTTKAIMKFEKVFWPDDVQYFGYMSEEKGKWPYFVNYRTFSDANILLPLSFGNYATAVEKKSNEEIQAEIMKILRKIFGNSIPHPIQFMVTRWSQDQYSLGAYTFSGVGNTPKDFNEMAQPVEDRLFFAGEHTIFKYHATLHGAYLSGIHAAELIQEEAQS